MKRVVYKIKLDRSENEFLFFLEEDNVEQEKTELNKSSVNEWNLEYELIYSSYILDN